MTPYQCRIACKGCGVDMGVFRVPKCHARTSRAGVAAELMRREQNAAVCGHCLGQDGAARKAARRAELAAEAAAGAQRRADRGMTQDERALTVACPLVRCGAEVGQECVWIAGALMLGSGATHAARLDAAYKARMHTVAAKYNGEHDGQTRREYLAEALAIVVERATPRQLALFV